jgi:hypothetical protein
MNKFIKRIFNAPKLFCPLIPGLTAIMEQDYIPARTKSAVARAINQDSADIRVFFPCHEEAGYFLAHGIGERVKRLGAVKGNVAKIANNAGFNFVGQILSPFP